MRRSGLVVVLLAALGSAAIDAGEARAARAGGEARHAAPLVLVRTIPLPGVSGRLGHLAFDPARQRLFVAAPDNGSLEVVDLRAGRRSRSLPGFRDPQDVVVIPGADRVAVAGGGDGLCVLLDAESLRERQRVKIGERAGPLRLDAETGRLYVGGDDDIVALEPAAGGILKRFALGGRPAAFELEPGGTRVFVDLPDAGALTAFDRAIDVAAVSWPLRGARGNTTMAIDTSRHALYIGCLKPARVLMLDTRAPGRTRAALDLAGVPGDLVPDPARGRLYAPCAEGFLGVLPTDSLELEPAAARIPTAPGARTSLLVPVQGRLYVAVPASGGRAAEVRVYRTRP